MAINLNVQMTLKVRQRLILSSSLLLLLTCYSYMHHFPMIDVTHACGSASQALSYVSRLLAHGVVLEAEDEASRRQV